MLPYPNIDPVFFKIGPLVFRWYGLAYVFGTILGGIVIKRELEKRLNITFEEWTSFLTYILMGILIGGRMGYVVFYHFLYYLQHPLEIVYVWQGGMSFHGGLIGCMVGVYLFSKVYQKSFWTLCDLCPLGGSIGIGLGRFSNFINGELFGRKTTLPWGMVFPNGGPSPRHPSQLYELFFESILILIILWIVYRLITLKPGQLFGVYIALYGFFRFFIEFFREPDQHIGLLMGFVSMGQLLCIVMIICGVGLFVFHRRGLDRQIRD